jgi:hypothetical protein
LPSLAEAVSGLSEMMANAKGLNTDFIILDLFVKCRASARFFIMNK